MWTFNRTEGTISREADSAGAYAGQPPYVNRVEDDWRESLGPLPAGKYVIGEVRLDGGHLGPFVMPLEPDPANDMKGRSAFYIHGDSIAHPGFASEGCIVTPRAMREKIAGSGDNQLEVI